MTCRRAATHFTAFVANSDGLSCVLQPPALCVLVDVLRVIEPSDVVVRWWPQRALLLIAAPM
jgi:hypothetical protein